MRDGYVARWRGIEYDASPDGAHVRLYTPEPAQGFVEVSDGRYRRGVLFDELEGFYYVRTVCTWRDQPFVVLGEFGAWLRLEYCGGNCEVAFEMGLEPFDVGVYQIWVPHNEVEDVREVQI